MNQLNGIPQKLNALVKPVFFSYRLQKMAKTRWPVKPTDLEWRSVPKRIHFKEMWT